MATSVKIELHNAGFNQLRSSPGVMADLNSRASRIQAAAGDGMGMKPATSSGKRGRASVFTESYRARYKESHDKALTRAIDAGR